MTDTLMSFASPSVHHTGPVADTCCRRFIFLWLPDRTEDRSGLVGKIATCWAKIGSRVWKGGRNDGLDGFLRFNNILKKSSKTGFRDR